MWMGKSTMQQKGCGWRRGHHGNIAKIYNGVEEGGGEWDSW